MEGWKIPSLRLQTPSPCHACVTTDREDWGESTAEQEARRGAISQAGQCLGVRDGRASEAHGVWASQPAAAAAGHVAAGGDGVAVPHIGCPSAHRPAWAGDTGEELGILFVRIL